MTSLGFAQEPVRNFRIAGRSVVAALLVAGIAIGGEGLWIPIKACLAQMLLEISWRGALAGEKVRPWPWADTHPIAKLMIERDGSETIVLSGANLRTMAFGPGHLEGSAMPGEPGNCVIAAHRDTHFSPLRYLGPGDALAVQRTDGRVVRYLVKATRIVRKENTSVLSQDGRSRLTLITCYPFESVRPGTPWRWVVVAEPVPTPSARSTTRPAGSPRPTAEGTGCPDGDQTSPTLARRSGANDAVRRRSTSAAGSGLSATLQRSRSHTASSAPSVEA